MRLLIGLKSQFYAFFTSYAAHCCRQVEEIIEETREEALRNEQTKLDHYTSIEEATKNTGNGDVDVKSIRERVVEEVSESIPTPGEPYFDVTLVEQEITPDSEVTNAMYV